MKFTVTVDSESIGSEDILEVLSRGGLKPDAVSVSETAQSRTETQEDT